MTAPSERTIPGMSPAQREQHRADHGEPVVDRTGDTAGDLWCKCGSLVECVHGRIAAETPLEVAAREGDR